MTLAAVGAVILSFVDPITALLFFLVATSNYINSGDVGFLFVGFAVSIPIRMLIKWGMA